MEWKDLVFLGRLQAATVRAEAAEARIGSQELALEEIEKTREAAANERNESAKRALDSLKVGSLHSLLRFRFGPSIHPSIHPFIRLCVWRCLWRPVVVVVNRNVDVNTSERGECGGGQRCEMGWAGRVSE